MTTPTTAVTNPAAAEQPLPGGWRGRLMPVNSTSDDNRMMTLVGEVVPARPLPIAFNAQETLDEGHDGSRVIGLITRLWIENGYVMGEGPLDLADPFAAEWARKLRDGFAGWVSIDLAKTTVEEVPLDESGNPIPPEVLDAYDAAWEAWAADPEAGPEPEPPVIAGILLRVTEWKVMGATLVSAPAFEDARVGPVFGEFDAPAAAALAAAAAAQSGDAEDSTAGEHTGAMIALVPANPDALAVDGGDPADELHLTVAYLGEAVDWTPDARAALHTAVSQSVLGGGVAGDIFGWATFNPNSPDPEKEPCAVYIVNSPDARTVRDAVWDVLANTPGVPALPENHDFVPHITAGYGIDVSKLTYTGPVTFDRLRIAWAGEATDLALDTEAIAASAGVMYHADDFTQPEPDHYVDSWQVTEDGRVSMHLAEWGQCHIGISNHCVTPPPGVDEYGMFHRLSVETDAGPVRVGKITMNTGHASTDPALSAAAVMSHYDNTGTLIAVVRCTDGVHGPWLSGRLVPWATKEQAQQLAHHEVSGDWRGDHGRPLQLVAALAVNTPGFMRSVAASGARVLIAAGRPRQYRRRRNTFAAPRPHIVTREQLRNEVRSVLDQMNAERAYATKVAPLDERARAEQLAQLDRRAWGR